MKHNRITNSLVVLATCCLLTAVACVSHTTTSNGSDTGTTGQDTQVTTPDQVVPPKDLTLPPADSDVGSPEGDLPNPGETATPSPYVGKVVINEILADPKAVDDTQGEYFELFNNGDSPVTLTGWTIKGSFDKSFVVKTAVTLAPKGYVVFAKSNDPKLNGGIPSDSGAPIYYFGAAFSLPNDAGEITLLDENGKLVQTLTYATSNGWPAAKPGVAIELITPTSDGNDGSNWAYAVNRYGLGDLGTPGLLNGYGPQPYKLDADDLGWQDPQHQASLLFSYFDDVEAVILSSLNGATTSVHMAMFNLRRDSIIDKLAEIKGKGIVEVKLLVDKKTAEGEQHNIDKYAEIAGKLGDAVSKVPMKDTNGDSTMHNKFTVIDGKRVLTGSLNYSTNALLFSDEDFLLIDDGEIAAIYELEFEELTKRVTENDFTHTPTVQVDGKMTVHFSPDDNPEAEILNKIAKAQSSITVVMFSLNRKEITTALIAAHTRGVKVMVILDQVQAENVPAECNCDAQDACTPDHGRCQDEVLENAGVTVFRFLNERSNLGLVEVHNKIAVFDGKHVISGSTNWTNLALLQNDENLVSIQSELLGAQVLREITQLLQFYKPGESAKSLGFNDAARDITLTVRGITVDATASLYLVGDNGLLGSQNYSLAKKLTKVGDLWTTTLTLEPGTAAKVHLFAKSKDGHNYPESKLRQLLVPYHNDPTSWSVAFDKQL